MATPTDLTPAQSRGTFRFVNVSVGSLSQRCIEVGHGDRLNVTDLHANTTEEEVRAQMVADGFIEIDRDGAPLDIRHNILQNDRVREIIDQAIAQLAALGIAGFNQPIVSPVDGSAGWFLIVAKNDAEVTSLRALLTAGCDGYSDNREAYLKALKMIALMRD